MPSDQLAVVLEHLRLLGSLPSGSLGGLDAMRRMTHLYAAASPATARLVSTVLPVDVEGIPGEWHITPGADHDRRLLYVHGGGWMAGSLGSHRSLVSAITAAFGGVTLAIDYRLAPEHPFPAGLDDCVAAYRWMQVHAPTGARPAHSCAIAGDSAGGNLTLATLVVLRDDGTPLPEAAVAVSPLTDFAGRGESRVTRRDRLAAAYLQGAASIEDPRVSPLEATLEGFPPLLIQVGDAEVLLSDATSFAERAEAAGVEVTLEVWDAMPHVFQLFTGYLPEADDAVDHIAAFLNRHCR